MNKHSIILSIAAIAGLALASGAFTGRELLQIEEDSVPPALPSGAVGVREVISARPYVLEVPYTHRWRRMAPGIPVRSPTEKSSTPTRQES